MECKLVAYGVMPTDEVKALITKYLEQNDRMDAHKVTFYSVDTALNTANKARAQAENERDALRIRVAELEAKLEE